MSTTRKDKIIILQQRQGILYPNDFKPNITVEQLIERCKNIHSPWLEDDIFELPAGLFFLAGRVMLKRDFGKISFLTLQDHAHNIQLQITNKVDGLDDHSFQTFKLCCDLGDIIGVSGPLFRTPTGELTLRVLSFKILVKSMLALPDKFRSIHGSETIYRQRYLDLITNKNSFQKFIKRSQIIKAIRNFMDDLDFFEVETPILHNIASGALAQPFQTYHNTLHIPLYLRIAPELYLKQLQVGGMSKIYEINKSFRNEGISSRHNPEFTMLECYEAYCTYEDMITLTQNLICHLCEVVDCDNPLLNTPFQVRSLLDMLCEYLQIQPHEINDLNLLLECAKNRNLTINSNVLGVVQTIMFDELISTSLVKPTFVTGYPIESSPLARANDENPNISDRFELFINGIEIANAYSELNDPEEQEYRLKAQNEMLFDKTYIESLKYGMPPCAGLGIGIDRLIMLLTNTTSIKDIILFPTLRPTVEQS